MALLAQNQYGDAAPPCSCLELEEEVLAGYFCPGLRELLQLPDLPMNLDFY